MNNQLDAIENYQLAILDIYEEMYKDSIKKSPGIKKNADGEFVQWLVAPTGDNEVDVFNVDLIEKVQTFFDKERDSVRIETSKRREDIRKAEQNFQNIEQINYSVNEYLESLVRLKESRDKLAKSLRDQILKIAPIPVSFGKIPDPSSFKDISKTLKIK